MHDLEFAFRQLLKNPGFTTLAGLMLALGAGPLFVGCMSSQAEWARPSSVGGTTESSDRSRIVLAGPEEAGERLTFGGRVRDYQGQPFAGAAVIAYHADASGRYNPPNSVTRVPRLRGVAITGTDGRFHFATIRPGAYPDGSEPAHIHLEIAAPAHKHRYVTCWFAGDPLIAPARGPRKTPDAETVIVPLEKQTGGGWAFHHDIQLEGN